MNSRLSLALQADEGFRAHPYRDTEGLWTIGIGTCLERTTIAPATWAALLDAGLIEVRLKHAGALLLLGTEIYRIEAALAELLPNWYGIEEPRRDVLKQLAYQMGVGFVYKFPRMIAAVNARDWPAARLHGLDSIWARTQTPERAARLMAKLEKGTW